MPIVHKIPIGELVNGNFIASIQPQNMVYFLCNIGDGDAQLLLLPEDEVTGERQAIVIDAGIKNKISWLIDDLVSNQLLPNTPHPNNNQHFPAPDGSIPLVIATHPHGDHIAGMDNLLRNYRHRITEFWDTGYYHPIASYINMMAEVERNSHLLYSQPTSGYKKWIGNIMITVLSPAILLKNRFDTYGTDINDSSISIRVEYPAARVVERGQERELLTDPTTMSLILGADSQTLSWSYILTDFPNLPDIDTAAAKAIKAATGSDLLKCDVMKISHHCSKRGVNFELMERIHPRVTLVSSVAKGGKYNFPHEVSQDIIREALEPVAKSGKNHKKDWELGLFYTSDLDSNNQGLGSIALVLGVSKITMWRFGDDSTSKLDFNNARSMA